MNGSADATGYIGTSVPPLPDGLASAGMETFPPDPTGAYALALVFGPDRQMLWLTEAAQDEGREAARRVIAVLEIPREDENVALIYTPGACRLDGEPDPEVVALARLAFTPTTDEVVRAWRADRAARRFDTLPADRVVCDTPRYQAGSEVRP